MSRGIPKCRPISPRRNPCPRSTGFCHIEVFVLSLLIVFLAAFLMFAFLPADSGRKPPRVVDSESAPVKDPMPLSLSPERIAASPPYSKIEPRFKPYSAWEESPKSSDS